MNRADRMLVVLKDGGWCSRRDIFTHAGFMLTNNAASELRARGFEVEQRRGDHDYEYRLASGAGTEAGGEKTPAPSLHAHKDTAPRSAGESSPSPDGSPAGDPLPSAGQLLLLDPYSRNVA